MKKVLEFLLAAALTLSLAACGAGGDGGGSENRQDPPSSAADNSAEQDNVSDGKSMTLDEMLAAAETGSLEEVNEACSENILNAKDTYCGKIYQYTGVVRTISSDGARIDDSETGIFINVTLSEDELKQLSTMQYVDIIGEISALSGGDILSGVTIDMDNAYILRDTYEVTGDILFGYLDPTWGFDSDEVVGKEEFWTVQIQDELTDEIYVITDDELQIDHEPGKKIRNIEIDGMALSSGDSVSLVGKVKYGSYTHELYDIQFLENSPD